MGAFVSAEAMIAAARGLTNTETLDEANSFVSNAEALAYLNGWLADLYDIICENHDDDFYRAAAGITLVGGQSVYPMPADFYKVISVDVLWGATIVRPAYRFTEAERDRFKYLNPTWSYLTAVYFRTVGDNIEFQPTPQAGINVQLNYIPAFTPLVALTDTFQSFNQWHWYGIYGLASDIAGKDDNEAAAARFQGKQAQIKQRVISHASSRNDGEPTRVNATRLHSEDDWT
jgi:hypothetical protein